MTSFTDPCFKYQGPDLFVEEVSAASIVSKFGSPCYVYSRSAIERQWHILNAAFGTHPHEICYAVKANSNLAVLNILARLGSGFDIVSAGELHRVLLAGGDASKIVFSGVAKSRDEIRFALESKIRCINVESIAELQRIQSVAQELGVVAAIGLRVNPDVDAQTHPYIATGLKESKFGIPMEAAFSAYSLANDMPNVSIHSVACHIGSQITKLSPFNDALVLVLGLVKKLSDAGIEIKQLDLGGGLGIQYQNEQLPSASDYIETLIGEMRAANIDLPIAIEPGRFIVGNSGILLTTVEYLKHNDDKHFAVVDAGMNDLLRPSLYQAFHKISNIEQTGANTEQVYDIVGPVCESSDVLGYDRKLSVEKADILAIHSAGAYAFSMASSYNSRPRPAEIIVDGSNTHLARAREKLEDLTKHEQLIPF